MGVVHHSNYVRYFEQARVVWLEEHDRPYTAYVADGLNFAVTRVELQCHRACRFDDTLDVTTWMVWVRGASFGMAYRIERVGGAGGGGQDRDTVVERAECVASGITEHAAVNGDGRLRRIPREDRERLAALSCGGEPAL